MGNSTCWAVNPCRSCGRGGASVLHDHGGADRDPIVEVDHIVVDHPEAGDTAPVSYTHLDVYKRQAEIHRAGAERVFLAALHVARQVRPAAQHLRRWGPFRPFLLRRNAVHAAPAKAIAADTDSVANGLAVAGHEVEPAFGGVHHDGAGSKVSGKADIGAGNGTAAAGTPEEAELGAPVQRCAAGGEVLIEALGGCGGRSGHDGGQCENNSGKTSHSSPRMMSIPSAIW